VLYPTFTLSFQYATGSIISLGPIFLCLPNQQNGKEMGGSRDSSDKRGPARTWARNIYSRAGTFPAESSRDIRMFVKMILDFRGQIVR